jgi:hypothetical protein
VSGDLDGTINEPNNPFIHPADVDTRIWRYMRLDHLESMLAQRGLWFSRLDVMHAADPFEGSLPAAVYAQLQKQYDAVVMSASKMFGEISSHKRVMISCWHISHWESTAMWKICAPAKAVCIQSTFGKLKTALGSNVRGIGLVSYIDYRIDQLAHNHPFWSRYFRKRKSFDFERELRAVHLNDLGPIPNKGFMVPVDLTSLIETIYVAPNAGDSFKAEVIEVVERADFGFPVHRSSIDDATVYDPFCGSGTALIAAEKTGRRCLAIELDPRYVQAAITRWEAYAGQRATRLSAGGGQ